MAATGSWATISCRRRGRSPSKSAQYASVSASLRSKENRFRWNLSLSANSIVSGLLISFGLSVKNRDENPFQRRIARKRNRSTSFSASDPRTLRCTCQVSWGDAMEVWAVGWLGRRCFRTMKEQAIEQWRNACTYTEIEHMLHA